MGGDMDAAHAAAARAAKWSSKTTRKEGDRRMSESSTIRVERSARRVVVTGMGVVSPVGIDVDTAWGNVMAGRSGIRRIAAFPAENLRVKIAGECSEFEPTRYMSAKDARRTDRFVQLAAGAAQQALEQSRIRIADDNADEVGVIIGTGAGGSTTYVAQQHIIDNLGPQRVNPMLIPMIIVDAASTHVSIMTGARGPSYGIAAACATSSEAIGQSF